MGHLVHLRKVQQFFSIIFSSVESNNTEVLFFFPSSLLPVPHCCPEVLLQLAS